ncbi:10561_t:CDS:2 [Ambispora leptoticha]|uniref:10561_t:CDS:1 n=1 Tax=Ambispora leptoticha TaxID=144679 RepID=A0A9N9AFZ0_9GLOM|nr:10561_t:CDS:2 [Ambispora leptoticha]
MRIVHIRISVLDVHYLTKMGNGVNVENCSYGATICAERAAIIKAVSEGQKKFLALGVSTDVNEFNSPCGMCRQFLTEFVHDNFPIYLVKPDRTYKKITFEKLMPDPFRLDSSSMEKKIN